MQGRVLAYGRIGVSACRRARRFERSLTSRYNFTKNSEPLGEMH